MKLNQVNLELLIKAYARTTSKNGIFISLLEYNENLANILKLSDLEMNSLIDTYIYLTDFSDQNEIEEFFNRIVNESLPEAQYALLVYDGEVIKEF